MAAPAAPDLTLLGLCDGELRSSKHQSSYQTNKVGGQPDWLPLVSRQPPRCGGCGAALVHVVQVYCPLEASPYHRNLHVFACPAAECQCWTVLRTQCSEAEEAAARTQSRSAPHQEPPLPATDWCDGADDWGVDEGGGDDDGWGGGVKEDRQVREEAADPAAETVTDIDVSSQLQDLTLGESQDVPVLRSFFISVMEESDLGGDEEDDLQHAQKLLKEYEKREGVRVGELDDGGEGGGGEEKYEKTRARHGDAVFSRFMKKIAPCPQQILRYCRGGKPLFVSEPPPDMAQVVSACSSCGGSRTFELQLMPALVSLLQRKDGGAAAELEFGTVVVYTCRNSCWTAGSRSALEEFCFVQADPDQQLFK